MNLLYRAKRKLFSFDKVRRNVVLTRPDYAQRHEGRDFIVLGTGSTISEYDAKLKQFIRDNSLITIGINGISGFTTPDYHLFCNRKRFVQYSDTIDSSGKSTVLLSVYFSDQFIRKQTALKYELVMFRDCNDPEICNIDSDYIISHTGATVSRAILLAYAMGANNVFVAGADGINDNVKAKTHFHNDGYSGLDHDALNEKYKYWFKEREPIALRSTFNWLVDNGYNGYIFVTPTNYGDYYNPQFLDKY